MSVYKEELLEHYHDPQNFGEVEGADIAVEENNPLCGDKQKWFLKLADENISKIGFTGDGCAISMAAASMLSEELKNKSTNEIMSLGEDDMKRIVGVDVSPARMKCLMLGLQTVQKGLTDSPSVIPDVT